MLPTTCTAISERCMVMNSAAGRATRNGGKQRTRALTTSAKLMWRFANR